MDVNNLHKTLLEMSIDHDWLGIRTRIERGIYLL